MNHSRITLAAFVMAGLASPAWALDSPPFVPTPMSVAPPTPKLAVLFALKLRLPEGRGLAARLLEAGVEQDDAALAARIAAGHLGAGAGGCTAKIEISRPLGATQFRVERVELTTDAGRAVIERRQGQLSLASVGDASRGSPIS